MRSLLLGLCVAALAGVLGGALSALIVYWFRQIRWWWLVDRHDDRGSD